MWRWKWWDNGEFAAARWVEQWSTDLHGTLIIYEQARPANAGVNNVKFIGVSGQGLRVTDAYAKDFASATELHLRIAGTIVIFQPQERLLTGGIAVSVQLWLKIQQGYSDTHRSDWKKCVLQKTKLAYAGQT